jgi:hypothetical protein
MHEPTVFFCISTTAATAQYFVTNNHLSSLFEAKLAKVN